MKRAKASREKKKKKKKSIRVNESQSPHAELKPVSSPSNQGISAAAAEVREGVDDDTFNCSG